MKLKILLLLSFVSVYAKAAKEYPQNVYVVTWNVGEEDPPKNLKELLRQDISKYESNPDIIIVGLQEVSTGLLTSLTGNKWSKEIDGILTNLNSYQEIKSESHKGLLLKVYVGTKYKETLGSVKQAITVKTGISGSKGAVIIKFDLNNLWYCVVNSQLPADDNKLQDRINDYKKINEKRVHFCQNSDYVFWLGDLNFRLDEKLKDQTIRDMIRLRKFNDLLKQDQLKVNHGSKKIFDTFTEQPITFAPTYKLEKGRDVYSPKQRPAWTDRILYKSDTGKIIKPTLYQSITSYKESDHFPVQAKFIISTNRYY